MGCDYYGIITFIFTAFSKKKKKKHIYKNFNFQIENNAFITISLQIEC